MYFFSDFLYDNTDLKEILKKLKNRKILGHLIHVLDPMEKDLS